MIGLALGMWATAPVGLAGRNTSATPNPKPGWTVIDLGVLRGDQISWATAINDRGEVAGESCRAADFPDICRAFLWADGRMRAVTPTGTYSWAVAMNGRGQIIGNAAFGVGNALERAFMWQDGKLRSLGVLPGDRWSEAHTINDLGQVVATSCCDPRAFLWENGKVTVLAHMHEPPAMNNRGQVIEDGNLWQNRKITRLGTLGGTDTIANAINDRGQIVGGSATSDRRWRCFLWKDGRMADLGTLGARSNCDAAAISDGGRVIGRSVTATGEPHGFLWRNGKMTDLGTLGGGKSTASAVNDNGLVVGTSVTTTGSTAAFVWQAGRMTRLPSLAQPPSHASALNAHDQIAGESISASGYTHAVLWKRR